MNARIEALPKKCVGCGETKPNTPEYFRSHRCGTYLVLRARCKACSNRSTKKRKVIRQQRKAEGLPVSEETTKRCTTCLTYKLATLEHFEPAIGHDSGLMGRCRVCRIGLTKGHKHAADKPNATDPKHVPVKVCQVCCNLSERRKFPKCDGCGECWEAEPKLRVEDFGRRVFERAV